MNSAEPQAKRRLDLHHPTGRNRTSRTLLPVRSRAELVEPFVFVGIETEVVQYRGEDPRVQESESRAAVMMSGSSSSLAHALSGVP